MIKDVMVRLDGSAADEVRLSAVNDIADLFDSQVTGLFLNVMRADGGGEGGRRQSGSPAEGTHLALSARGA